MFLDLESSDHSFKIDLNSLNIRQEDIDKITKAWARGHFIFTDTNSYDFNNINISIYSVTSKSRARNAQNEITQDWPAISKRLSRQDVPDEWVKKAIEKAKEMEDWLHDKDTD